MEQLLNNVRQIRKNFIQLIENSSVEELNQVPEGFNNNIIWNFGHIITSQQALFYLLSAIPPKISPQYMDEFRRGTKPERFISQEEINDLKKLMLSTIDELEEDLENQVFVNYISYTTVFGVTLNSAKDALQFFPIHDAYHYGCATAIKRVINNNKN